MYPGYELMRTMFPLCTLRTVYGHIRKIKQKLGPGPNYAHAFRYTVDQRKVEETEFNDLLILTFDCVHLDKADDVQLGNDQEEIKGKATIVDSHAFRSPVQREAANNDSALMSDDDDEDAEEDKACAGNYDDDMEKRLVATQSLVFHAKNISRSAHGIVARFDVAELSAATIGNAMEQVQAALAEQQFSVVAWVFDGDSTARSMTQAFAEIWEDLQIYFACIFSSADGLPGILLSDPRYVWCWYVWFGLSGY
jgi:hypothetical protein